MMQLPRTFKIVPVALALLTACSAASSPGLTAGPSASAALSGPLLNATPATTPVPSPTFAAAPLAIFPGEPWIVYQWLQECDADDCDDQGVYLVRPDGRDRHLLLTTPAGRPDWSPDGRRIAVGTEPANGTGEIWTLSADGTGVQQLIACSGVPCMYVGLPAWSPDGRQMAFQRFLQPKAPGYQDAQMAIEVLDLESGATRVVAMSPVADSEYVEYFGPRWSPDGTKIVFEVMSYPMPPTDENILSTSIAIVDADASEADAPRVLTDPTLFGSYPDWSPDGQRIVFNTYPLVSFQDTTKATNLYTIRPDGTDLTQVTHYGESDTRATQPTWTPDGQGIIFTLIERNPSNPWGERQPALIDADGSDLTLVPWAGTHARMRPTP